MVIATIMKVRAFYVHEIEGISLESNRETFAEDHFRSIYFPFR